MLSFSQLVNYSITQWQNVIICAIYALHAAMIVTGNANRGQNILHVVYILWYCSIIYLMLHNPIITFVLILSHCTGGSYCIGLAFSLRFSCPLTLTISSTSICCSRFSGSPPCRKLRALGLTIYHISFF